MPLSIQELWRLNNKAQENFSYSGKEKRYLEAFLIQSCLLEGALKEFAILLIRKELKQSSDIVKKKEKNINLIRLLMIFILCTQLILRNLMIFINIEKTEISTSII